MDDLTEIFFNDSYRRFTHSSRLILYVTAFVERFWFTIFSNLLDLDFLSHIYIN